MLLIDDTLLPILVVTHIHTGLLSRTTSQQAQRLKLSCHTATSKLCTVVCPTIVKCIKINYCYFITFIYTQKATL